MKVKSLSRVRLLATPWTAAHQAPPSMGVSRQEYWSGVPLPSLELTLHHVKYLNFLPRNEKVVNCLHQNRNALFRLVCFPWGRGGSTYFAKWGQDIPNFVEGM